MLYPLVEMNTDNRDEQVTTQAINEYVHLVRIVVARFVRRLPPSVQRDDLVAAGMVGLVRALQSSGHIRTSCPEMFTAYARIRIRGAILDELRRHDWSPRRRRARREESAEATAAAPASIHVMGFDDLSPDALGNMLGEVAQSQEGPAWGTRSPEDELAVKTFGADLRRCIDELPGRERAIIQMRYFDGIPSKEIASILGVSEARVSQLHTRATELLRERLAADEMPIAA